MVEHKNTKLEIFQNSKTQIALTNHRGFLFQLTTEIICRQQVFLKHPKPFDL